MSSRNRFLSPAERSSALVLNASLRAAEAETTPAAARAAAQRVLAGAIGAGEIELDYVTVVNAATMVAVPDDHTGPALAMIAARVGSTRLIDNVELTYPELPAAPDTPAEEDAARPPAVLRPVAD